MKNFMLAAAMIIVGTLIGVSLKDATAQTAAGEWIVTHSEDIETFTALKYNPATGETFVLSCFRQCDKNEKWFSYPVENIAK